MRTENEKGNYFINLEYEAGRQTRKLQIHARILRDHQVLMKSHAILVFLNVFCFSAGLCQIPLVYADAGFP